MRREAVTLDEYERGVEDMASVAQQIAAEEKRAAEAKSWARYRRAAQAAEAVSRSRGGQKRARQEQAEKRARQRATA